MLSHHLNGLAYLSLLLEVSSNSEVDKPRASVGSQLPRNGAKRTRTADPLNAIEVLYQLSYSPECVHNNALLTDTSSSAILIFILKPGSS